MVDKIQAVFVLHFPLRAKIGQEFKRLLTNLVISVSRHFPSASLEMEGLLGSTSTTSSTPHRFHAARHSSAPGFNQASGGTPTDGKDADSSLGEKHEKKPEPSTCGEGGRNEDPVLLRATG